MGAILQTLYMLGVVALFPAVQGLRRDIEVTAGKSGIVAVGIVVIKPFESSCGFL
jgi:hypothetical protein